jgi:hypothetical protein
MEPCREPLLTAGKIPAPKKCEFWAFTEKYLKILALAKAVAP